MPGWPGFVVSDARFLGEFDASLSQGDWRDVLKSKRALTPVCSSHAAMTAWLICDRLFAKLPSRLKFGDG
jgi:hypothetical protein